MTTTRLILAALAVAVPGLAMAGMPAVGDVIGTTPDAVKAALEAAGCTVDEIEPEKGKVEAKCHEASGKEWEVYIDPASGKVTNVTDED